MKKVFLVLLIGGLVSLVMSCSNETVGTGINNESYGHLKLALNGNGPPHDVVAIQVKIVDAEAEAGCDAEAVAVKTEALKPEALSGSVLPSGAGSLHPFADALFVLPVKEYRVCATPLSESGPSSDCDPVSKVVGLFAEATVEVVLISQCTNDPKGGLDVVVALNDPPLIDDLQISPNKFISNCASVTITVVASDPNVDSLSYRWEVLSNPQYATLIANGSQAYFRAHVAGDYQLRVSVSDAAGGSTALQFPIHVLPADTTSDPANCGGCGVSCDDSNVCTTDSCDALLCKHFPVSGCCQPKTCRDLGTECGIGDDGCGGTLACGNCTGYTKCESGRCVPNLPVFEESRGVNICEKLLEDLIIPPTYEDVIKCKHFDWYECLALPHCCLPGACLLDPVCYFVDKVLKTAEEIYHAGDVYCGIREISARDLLEKIVRGQISNLAQVLTAGALLPFFDLINTDFDTIYALSVPVPDNVRSLLLQLIEPVYDGGSTGFAYEDLENVKIISNKFPTAGLYLRDGYDAITIGRVVIFREAAFQALISPQNSNINYADFLLKDLDQTFVRAVDTLVHELVHVKQYRELGQDSFLTNYFLEYLVSGYGGDSFEKEAYTFAATLADLHGGKWCEVTKDQHDSWIQQFDLGIPFLTCY